MGWFAGSAAKQERANAERAAGALPGSLERIGEAEGRAERAYREGVEAQRAADATPVPHLSAAAEAAVGAVRAVPDDKARAEAWRAVQKDQRVAGELGAFRAAVAQRFGDEGVREMLRAARRGEQAGAAAAERQVASVLATISGGERVEAAQQREAEQLTQRRGLRM